MASILEVMVSLIEKVRSSVRPLEEESDLEPLFGRIAGARVVMIGEASHGTSEFYRWRERITRTLIADHGFSFVAVEGDWPDCMRLTRFLKGGGGDGEDAREVLSGFVRWPSWMWANHEVADFAEWLREFNEGRQLEERVGFYGLDVYSLWDSLQEVLRYLDTHDGEALAQAHRAMDCFAPYGDDAQAYARSVPFVSPDCRDEVVELLIEVQDRARIARGEDPDDLFDLEQNARVAKGAEAYYRKLIHGGGTTWNLRDRHMMETLLRLLSHHGRESRAVVWAHNTHVGDARHTDMPDAGLLNLGQLAREELGSGSVALVGFGSHTGHVIASTEWGEPFERMVVPPGREGSWEDVFHKACGGEDALLLCDGLDASFYEKRHHRAIGVVYHPAYERLGNYVPTVLPRRYDAFLHIDRTSALRPLHVAARLDHELPQTFPSGQ